MTMQKMQLAMGHASVACSSQDSQLVGGLEHLDYFPFHIWDVIRPIDEVIFFKMVKTINQNTSWYEAPSMLWLS